MLAGKQFPSTGHRWTIIECSERDHRQLMPRSTKSHALRAMGLSATLEEIGPLLLNNCGGIVSITPIEQSVIDYITRKWTERSLSDPSITLFTCSHHGLDGVMSDHFVQTRTVQQSVANKLSRQNAWPIKVDQILAVYRSSPSAAAHWLVESAMPILF